MFKMDSDQIYCYHTAVRGYHHYQRYWKPEENQKLYLWYERENLFDIFAINVCDKKDKNYWPSPNGII